MVHTDKDRQAVTGTLRQVFSEAELAGLEAGADEVDLASRAEQLPSSCFHVNRTRAGGLKRTKFFFSARCVPVWSFGGGVG